MTPLGLDLCVSMKLLVRSSFVCQILHFLLGPISNARPQGPGSRSDSCANEFCIYGKDGKKMRCKATELCVFCDPELMREWLADSKRRPHVIRLIRNTTDEDIKEMMFFNVPKEDLSNLRGACSQPPLRCPGSEEGSCIFAAGDKTGPARSHGQCMFCNKEWLAWVIEKHGLSGVLDKLEEMSDASRQKAILRAPEEHQQKMKDHFDQQLHLHGDLALVGYHRRSRRQRPSERADFCIRSLRKFCVGRDGSPCKYALFEKDAPAEVEDSMDRCLICCPRRMELLKATATGEEKVLGVLEKIFAWHGDAHGEAAKKIAETFGEDVLRRLCLGDLEMTELCHLITCDIDSNWSWNKSCERFEKAVEVDPLLNKWTIAAGSALRRLEAADAEGEQLYNVANLQQAILWLRSVPSEQMQRQLALLANKAQGVHCQFFEVFHLLTGILLEKEPHSRQHIEYILRNRHCSLREQCMASPERVRERKSAQHWAEERRTERQQFVSSCLAAPLPKEDLLPLPPTLPIRPLPKSSTAKLRRRILCDFWEGSCRRGSDCPWAHNTDEMQVARVQVSKDGRRKNERRQANQKRHSARMVCMTQAAMEEELPRPGEVMAGVEKKDDDSSNTSSSSSSSDDDKKPISTSTPSGSVDPPVTTPSAEPKVASSAGSAEAQRRPQDTPNEVAGLFANISIEEIPPS